MFYSQSLQKNGNILRYFPGYLLLFIFCFLLSPADIIADILLNQPQKIVVDYERNQLLVSNFGNGALVKIDSLGNQAYIDSLNANFIDGLDIVGDIVYGVGNGRTLSGYNLETEEKVLDNFDFPGSAYLSSVTSDSLGHLFISCPGENAIYKFRLSDQAYWIFAQGDSLNRPNGILLERANDRIIVIDDSPTTSIIHAISLSDSTVSGLMHANFDSPDGIVRDRDGYYYVGGFYLPGLYKIDPAFSQTPELFFPGNQMVYPTYDYLTHSLLVTYYGSNDWDRIFLGPAVENIHLYDDGTGTGLFLTWDSSEEENFDHFLVEWGTASGNYQDSFSTTGSELLVFGLEEGQECFIALTQYFSDGTHGFVTEVSATPSSFPRIPADFIATPAWGEVQLTWLANQEMDIAGYRIYRSDTFNGNYELTNPELITESHYEDSDVENGVFYFYKIEAVDFGGYSSGLSEACRSRVISMDQGILLVDDTSEGNGNFLRPTDEQCSEFYNQILGNFSFDELETDNLEKVRLDDLCAYSTVIWYIDDNTLQYVAGESMADIQAYLENGGKLFLSGYKPISSICDLPYSPYDFEEGSFGRDFLKLTSLNYNNNARFNQAIHVNNEHIHTDPDKIPANFNAHILGVEGLYIDNSAVSSYTYGTGFEIGTPAASLAGLAVNSCYIDEDSYSIYLLTFPLYYMQIDEVTALMNYVIGDLFNEPVSADDEEIVITEAAVLLKNYPNPFNPATTISFSLEKEAQVDISIYNLKGQKVKTLLHSILPADEHTIVWNGCDEGSKLVSSGIYLFRMETGKYISTKKMLLLK